MIFPCAFDGLKELKSLDLSGCILSGDKIFDRICLTTLVVSLPDSISQLYRLRYLNITHCHELKKLPKLPQSIKELYAEDFLAIQSTLALLIYRRLYLVSVTNYSFNQQSYTEKSNDMLPQDWYDHTFIKAKLICNNHSEELKVLETECKVSTTSRSYSWCVCFAYIPFHTLQQMSDTEVTDFNQYGLFEASIQRKIKRQWGVHLIYKSERQFFKSRTEKELPAERLSQVNLVLSNFIDHSFIVHPMMLKHGMLPFIVVLEC